MDLRERWTSERTRAAIADRIAADSVTGGEILQRSRANGDGWSAHLTRLQVRDGSHLLVAVLTATGGDLLTVTIPHPVEQFDVALQVLSTVEHAPERLGADPVVER